jgi:hypothetical protein
LIHIFKVIDDFINNLFTNHLRWRRAPICVSQVTRKDIAELECPFTLFLWLAHGRDSRLVGFSKTSVIKENVCICYTINTLGCVETKLARSNILHSITVILIGRS